MDGRGLISLSPWRTMWLFAMFDLPVLTRDNKRDYQKFVKLLKKEGFSRLQYSVYARYCPSEESAQAYRNHLRIALPPAGQVRVLTITDHQFGKMENFFGKMRQKVEDPPAQLLLF